MVFSFSDRHCTEINPIHRFCDDSFNLKSESMSSERAKIRVTNWYFPEQFYQVESCCSMLTLTQVCFSCSLPYRKNSLIAMLHGFKNWETSTTRALKVGKSSVPNFIWLTVCPDQEVITVVCQTINLVGNNGWISMALVPFMSESRRETWDHFSYLFYNPLSDQIYAWI